MIASERSPAAEVAVIGLGVIGGSVALRLRERGTPLSAFSTSDSDRALASAAGIAVAPSVAAAVRDAGLVLVAVPLDLVGAVASQVIAAAPARATVFHAASLQRSEALLAPPETTARTIGTHPLAGSHRTGFAAAAPDLFRRATVYVESRATARQREDAELFWSLAGAARVEYASAEEHDAAMAWASHLPQLASTALAATLVDETRHARAGGLSVTARPGPGARDTTRLAMSALEIWRPILQRAPDATIDALRALEEHVRELRASLERQDWAAVARTWERARTWRFDAEHEEHV